VSNLKINSLPKGWTSARIDKVCDVNPRLNKSEISDDLMVSFVPMPAVGAGNGSIDVSNERPASEVKKGFTAFKQGDVLFAKITPCMENGKMAIVPKVANEHGFGSTEFHVLRPNEGVESRYVYYYVSSQNFRGVAERYMTGAVGQKRVSTTYLKEQEIPLAPPEEQKRIVAEIEKQFSRLDEAVANLKRVKANLKRYKAAVLKAAVEGKLTEEWRKQHPDVEPADKLLERIIEEREARFQESLLKWQDAAAVWEASGKEGKKPAKPRKPKDLPALGNSELSTLPLLPQGWVWTRLGNLNVDVFDGPFGSNLKSSDYVDAGVRVIRLENIGSLKFVDEKESFVTEEKFAQLKKHTVGAGDIIFSSFVAEETRVVMLPEHIETSINKADCFCVRSFGKTVQGRYLETFLATGLAYDQLGAQIHGATRPRINTTQLKDCLVAVPPSVEQPVIMDELTRQLSILDVLHKELDVNILRSERLRQSILNNAFSGKFK